MSSSVVLSASRSRGILAGDGRFALLLVGADWAGGQEGGKAELWEREAQWRARDGCAVVRLCGSWRAHETLGRPAVRFACRCRSWARADIGPDEGGGVPVAFSMVRSSSPPFESPRGHGQRCQSLLRSLAVSSGTRASMSRLVACGMLWHLRCSHAARRSSARRRPCAALVSGREWMLEALIARRAAGPGRASPAEVDHGMSGWRC